MKKFIVGLAAGVLIGSAATAVAAEDVAKEVKALLASFNFKVNGVEKHLETTPLVYEGTAYLPVREVATLTGYEVDYKEGTRTIDLKSNPPSTPPSADAAQETTKTSAKEQTKDKNNDKPKPKAGEGNWVYVFELEDAFVRNQISIGLSPRNNETYIVWASNKLFKADSYYHLIDITPLIRDGIVTLEAGRIIVGDLDKAPKMETKQEAKVGNGNWVHYHDLMTTFDQKKINSYGGGGGSTTIYTVNGTDYKLQQSLSGLGQILVDMTPLIDAGLITLDDVTKKPAPRTDHLPKVKTGEGNWVLYSDLQAALRRKFDRAGGSGGNEIPEYITVGIERKGYKLTTGLNEKGELMVDMTPLIEANQLSLYEVKGNNRQD